MLAAAQPAPAAGAPARLSGRDIDAALAAAAGLEATGALDAARRELAALREQLPAGDLADDVTLRRCALWDRAAAPEAAAACYREATAQATGPEARGRGRLGLAAALSARGDGRGGAERLAIVEALPATDAARRAAVALRADARAAGGDAGELACLGRLTSTLAWAAASGTPARVLLAECMVATGRLQLQGRAGVDAAVATLIRARAVARGTSWQDDAQIWLARGLVAQGHPAAALAAYHAIIDHQQTPWIIGRYYSQYLDDALFEAAATHAQMGDEAAARGCYAELLRLLPGSVLADDAAWVLARLDARASGDDAPLRAFARAYPGSPLPRRAAAAGAGTGAGAGGGTP